MIITDRKEGLACEPTPYAKTEAVRRLNARVTDTSELVSRLAEVAEKWKAFVNARTLMNLARPNPDTTKATRAEYALYDERYQADNEAQREFQREAIEFAQWASDHEAAEALSQQRQRIEALEAVVRRSAEGWANVVEMGLIPQQHVETASNLGDECRQALGREG
jgi:nitrate reductase assembly molybdenum cofactor insertion protein NarJ